MNYDPNLTMSGNMAVQTVKLVFGQWLYRAEVTVKVRGNITGLDVVKSAVSSAYDKLPIVPDGMGGEAPGITMKRDDGNDLECTDDDDAGEDWLAEMLIYAEIIDIQPDA